MIAIVDYGLGNIKAFSNIYRRYDIPHFFAKNSEELRGASKIILPGVGAFDYAMSKLNGSGMKSTLDELVLEKKTPVIGICVGMQMMADFSDEGTLPGLGWIPGEVKKLPASPLPHMGWNNLKLKTEDAIFKDLELDPQFYFLHSFYFQCKNDLDTIATAEYGHQYACIIRKENIYGIQCHPEKSHHNGVSLLKNFASF